MANRLSLLFSTDFYGLPRNDQQEVYEDFYRLVYPMVYFIVKDHQTAEDIIQESFLKAIDKSNQLQHREKAEGWLKALTRNVSLSALRKRKRSLYELDCEDVFVGMEGFVTEPFKPLEQEVEAKLLKEAIERYISMLKPEYRQLMEMRWMGHLSYREMAEAVGTTEDKVRQRLFRAREAVKLRLMEEWGIG